MKLQATGYLPIEINPQAAWSAKLMMDGEKRGIGVAVFKLDDRWVGLVEYGTSWPTERPYSWVLEAPTLTKLGEDIRALAPTVLPPGAGFPAAPQFDARQRKLVESLQTLTLVVLTDVLAQAHTPGEQL